MKYVNKKFLLSTEYKPKKFSKLFVLLFTFLFSSLILAEEKHYGDVIVSKVNSVYDGDTFTVTINKWPAIIGDQIEIRVAGIDTAEIRTKCTYEKQLAIQAKEFTIKFLTTNKRIYLKNISRDMYFRIDADVIIDNKSLGEELIKAGLAKPYDGGTKTPWCPTIPKIQT